MGRKKLSSPAAQGAASSADASTETAPQQPAAPARTTQADTLVQAFADMALHSQASAGSSTRVNSSSNTTSSSTAPPSAPHNTASSSEADSAPDLDAMWAQVQQLHDTQGVGYLAAVIQASPDLAALRDSGERDEAYGRAVALLFDLVECEAAGHDLDGALAVIKTAHREALTTLSLEHQVTVLLSLQLATTLTSAGQYETALKHWRWLLSRGALLPSGWEDCFDVHLGTAHCLSQLGRHADAVPHAYEAYKVRQAPAGEADGEQAFGALATLVDSYCEAQSVTTLPAATAFPLLRKFADYLRRTEDGSEYAAREILRVLDAMMLCVPEIGNMAEAEKLCRERVALTKRLYGMGSDLYWKDLELHGLTLIKQGQYAKAVALLTKALNESVRTQGADHASSLGLAANLGAAFVNAKEYDRAITVLEKAWQSAQKVLSADSDLHMQLWRYYEYALETAGYEDRARELSREGLVRGLPVWRLLEGQSKEYLESLLPPEKVAQLAQALKGAQ